MKPFSFSWSKLKNYRTCPKRHYEVDIAKNIRENETEQLKWGNLVHKSMEDFIAKGVPLPATVSRYDSWPKNVVSLKDAGVKTVVEQNLAIGKDFGATGYFAPDTWFRAKIDVLMPLPEHKVAISIDWKTGGKVEPEFEQLGLSSQTVFAHYPEVDQVASIYVWLGHNTQTIKIYNRSDMVPLWNSLWPVINEMAEAHRTLTYPPKPSGLCKSYCPVTSCPYHGKGSPR